MAGGQEGVLQVWNGTTGQTLAVFKAPEENRPAAQANASGPKP